MLTDFQAWNIKPVHKKKLFYNVIQFYEVIIMIHYIILNNIDLGLIF